ncbi:MAG: DUF1631 family protein [Hahellaceae bacterium]|nr:DUF1631 family protein [Hahellaceae bacterium]
MERRSSQRKPIYLEATLSWKNKTSWPCSVEDFCAEGMFIKFDADIADRIHFIVGRQEECSIDVLFRIGDKPHKVTVKPVRLIEGAMGVMYTHSEPATFAALLTLCGAPAEEARMSSDNNKAAFVIRQCGKAIERFTEPLMDAFYDDVDVALREAATHAISDQVANEIMDCVNNIARRKPVLMHAYFDQLQMPLKGLPETGPNGENLSLAVVDKHEFEDWLTIKVMITKAETLYRGALLQLKMRLDKVGVINETGHQNPFGPALICQAFKNAASQLRMPKQAEKVYYRTFEMSVLRKLEDLYNELNQVLVRQNILPDLDLSKYLSSYKKPASPEPAVAKKNTPEKTTSEGVGAGKKETPAADAGGKSTIPDRGKPEPGTAAVAKEPAIPLPDVEETAVAEKGNVRFVPKGMVKPTITPKPLADVNWERTREENLKLAMRPPFSEEPVGSEVSAQASFTQNRQSAEAVFKTVQNLFAVLEQSRNPGKKSAAEVAEMSAKPKWNPVELQKSLQKLQAVSLHKPAEVEQSTLSDRVRQQIKEASDDKILAPEQEETLDVVDRFFASMKGNQKLTEQAKAQLSHLQVPVLKVLLKDKQFFDDKDSPVRAVINRIAQLGVKGGRPSPAQQQRIDGVIERISREFDQDTGVFDEVLGELDELIDRQNLLYRRNVERVVSAAEGTSKLEDAKRVVGLEIERRIAGRKIPKAVVSLINGGWRDLLSLTFIRQGEESQAWLDYLSVLDTLVAYGDNPHMDVNLPELLRIIQEGLSSISSNHMPSGNIRDELKRFIVGSKERPPEMIEMPPQAEESESADLALLAESRQRSLQRWVARAQKMKIGDWIKYSKDPESPQHMRLVWIAKGFSKFVFVNHQGMKVVELELIKLATLLQKEIATPEPDYEVPVVDESLDNMVKQVYEQLSFASTHDDITGLANRKEIERAVDGFLDLVSEDGPCSIIHLDLRQFRIINDSAGYDAGDKLLETVAGLLRSYAPKGAVLGRMGGNEFAVVLRQHSVEPLARHLIKSIHEHRFEWDGKQYDLSVSVGVAVANEYLTNAERLLNAAESACRNAKKLGYNRLYTYNAEQDNFSQQEQIVAKVAGFKDLNKERVLLRCQKVIPLKPDVALSTHYEILLSIYDDVGHLIPAREFVRTAELYNRMQTVDRWVVGHMLDWMVENKAAMEVMGSLCINLSGHSLNDEELLEFIYDRMSQKKSPLEKVCFEITEASAISNINDVADFMTELKETGCRFCLGSFGAGMSSYQFLKSLPVDMIKIDGSFTKDLAKNAADRAIVNSMTEMVHLMGREVVASQVEDKASLEILKSMGVDYAQGYCIEKPRLINSF